MRNSEKIRTFSSSKSPKVILLLQSYIAQINKTRK